MIKSKVQSSTPAETPEEKAAREAEQARAEAAQIDQTQGFLRLDTLRRQRRYGVLGGTAFGGAGGSTSGALRIGAPSGGGSSSGMTSVGASTQTSSGGLGRNKLLVE